MSYEHTFGVCLTQSPTMVYAIPIYDNAIWCMNEILAQYEGKENIRSLIDTVGKDVIDRIIAEELAILPNRESMGIQGGNLRSAISRIYFYNLKPNSLEENLRWGTPSAPNIVTAAFIKRVLSTEPYKDIPQEAHMVVGDLEKPIDGNLLVKFKAEYDDYARIIRERIHGSDNNTSSPMTVVGKGETPDPPKAKKFTGVIIVDAKGNNWVMDPENDKPIFIPPDRIIDAKKGDTVLCHANPPRSDGKIVGMILKVLKKVEKPAAKRASKPVKKVEKPAAKRTSKPVKKVEKPAAKRASKPVKKTIETMTLAELKDYLDRNGIKIPAKGSGSGGRVVKADLFKVALKGKTDTKVELMTTAELREYLHKKGVKLPQKGSGSSGKIVKADLLKLAIRTQR